MRKDTLFKKAIFYEYATITWNVFEGIVCVAIGLLSGSISLFAYGLESSIEVFASAVVIWELHNSNKKNKKKALMLIGIAYLAVSAYIFIDASKGMLAGHHPDRSIIGILFMIATAIIMLALGLIKKSIGRKMQSITILADAKFTLIDAVLSCTVLLGLILNTFFGFWWADQAMAMFLSGIAFREGLKELL